MKKFLLSIFLFIFPNLVNANPACVVCTATVGASLFIARKFGISDNVVALWSGTLLALFGYWTILWFDKKNWHFPFRNHILMFLSFCVIFSLYFKQLEYMPQIILYVLYIDPFLFWAIIGFLLYIYSQKFYQFLKKKNGGHAHFPFEKVAIPLGSLILLSFYIIYFF